MRVGGIAWQVSREAPSTGFRRRGGGSAGRRSDVICLRLGGAQPLPDFRCRLLQCLPSADPSTLGLAISFSYVFGRWFPYKR